MNGIPKRLHFCFGLSPDFSRKPWSLMHFACVKSAVLRIQPQYASLYYQYEPSGPWWDLTKSLVDAERIVAPTEIFGNPLMHAAHRADVVRLQKLLIHGGIYLDCDVLVIKSFDPLLGENCVLGREGDAESGGICNAVILAQQEAPFLKRWLETYKSFRSKGRDEFWNEHSVGIPKQLAAMFPEELTLLGHKAFYWPMWTADHLKWMFASTRDIDAKDVFAHHLWETYSWIEYIENLSISRVRSHESNFHTLIRPLLTDLPETFGAPSPSALVATKIRGGLKSPLTSSWRRLPAFPISFWLLCSSGWAPKKLNNKTRTTRTAYR
jgi:hypothetical protein